MKHIIDDQVVLSRPLEGPLATQIAAFARDGRARSRIRVAVTIPAGAARGRL